MVGRLPEVAAVYPARTAHRPPACGAFLAHNRAMFTSTSAVPHAAALAALEETLLACAARSADEGPWRSGAMAELAASGALAGFVPAAHGGTAAGEPALLALLAAIAARCLTTALAVSQWASAVRIIAAGAAADRESLLPDLARGRTFTTVGVSQLTTSRRHLGAPALTAARAGDSWRLDGVCPWVTGADACDTIVTGATEADGGQMFFVVPTSAAGLTIEPPLPMLALSGSRTSCVRFSGVRPAATIAPAAGGLRTGGLATTALAIGAARASIGLLAHEAVARAALEPVVAGLSTECEHIAFRMLTAARDGIDQPGRDALRGDANGLVVRAAQAALTASKGAGYVQGHPAERLVRESLFFLVWSCPQSVSAAALCELAGLA
ncbi:MAG: acyl-CoA dehydrogenase [Planctomycetota bacterium]|nr:MAG: acyl-CoA dehydrogenase [Planctomycetota bacterium]